MVIMKKSDFMDEILQQTRGEFEGEAEVKLHTITKNNGVILTGITISQKEVNISPTIYLDAFYEDYQNGRSMEDMQKEIVEIYEKSKLQKSVDMNFFTEWEHAKERIVFKLVNYNKNKKLLSHTPHRRVLDLAVVYYYLVDKKEFANATILIDNKHIETWQVAEAELYELAKKNTPVLLKANLWSMLNILQEFGLEDWPEEDIYEMEESQILKVHGKKDISGMYVLSNETRMFGAVVMLYPGVLKRCAEILECDYFILPSSVHEVILVPDEGIAEEKKLRTMVKDVNETQLEVQEVLSDAVYYFSAKTGNIQCL